MKINGIQNNTNFGLLKTKAYRDVEIDLIRRAQAEGKERQARFLSDRIGQKLPKSLLDTDSLGEKFILMDRYKDTLLNFEMGEIDKTNPVHTLFSLNKRLSEAQNNLFLNRPFLEQQK